MMMHLEIGVDDLLAAPEHALAHRRDVGGASVAG